MKIESKLIKLRSRNTNIIGSIDNMACGPKCNGKAGKFKCIYLQHTSYFPGAFEKLRKRTIANKLHICLSVRPSVRMVQIGSHWTDFN